jgi:hypothetical protein
LLNIRGRQEKFDLCHAGFDKSIGKLFGAFLYGVAGAGKIQVGKKRAYVFFFLGLFPPGKVERSREHQKFVTLPYLEITENLSYPIHKGRVQLIWRKNRCRRRMILFSAKYSARI